MVDAVQEKTAGGVRDLSCVMDTFKPCLECSVTETSMKDNHEQPTSSFQLQEGLRPLMDFLVATMMTRELSSVEKMSCRAHCAGPACVMPCVTALSKVPLHILAIYYFAMLHQQLQ